MVNILLHYFYFIFTSRLSNNADMHKINEDEAAKQILQVIFCHNSCASL